jgi:hypothetical protein
MKINIFIACIFFTIAPASMCAQVISRADGFFFKEFRPSGESGTKAGLGPDSISYDKIDGSAYWVDAFRTASLYDSKGYVATLPVRINLLTNQIHFLKGNEEMVVDDNVINRIVFLGNNDSTVFIGQVPHLLVNNKPFNKLVQVLNAGKYQLLKYTSRNVTSEETPSHTSRVYQYKDTYRYFMKSEERVEDIKKLSSENILIYLPVASSYNEWIKENKINFKNEKDIIRFLNHYNSNIKN